MVVVTIGFVIFGVIAVYVIASVAGVGLMRLHLARKVEQKGTLVLTFDDGPGNRLTPVLLELLEKHGCKATFFLLGRNITGREDLVRQIRAEGHEIASHGYDHLNYWRVFPWRALNDVRRGWAAIDAALGTDGGKYAFRPPYGKLDILTMLYLWTSRVPICYWTVDSTDTWSKDRRDESRVVAQMEQAGGAVVLAHDFDRNTTHVDALVLQCVDSVLKAAKHQGIPVKTFSELNHRHPSLEAQGSRPSGT